MIMLTLTLLKDLLNKKKCEISHLEGGGVQTNFGPFHTFFSTLNHANMLRYNVHGGWEGCSLYKKIIFLSINIFCVMY